MLNSNSPLSLQYQLREALYEKLNSGEWEIGSQIPSEYELCEEYGVSRITVREVLKDLVQAGYLQRKQGKGTFVSKPNVEASLIGNYSLTEELEKKGTVSEFKLIDLQILNASESQKKLFELSDDEKIVQVIRVRLANGEIYAWERAQVPEKFLKGITAKEICDKGLYPSIEKRTGLYPVEANERLEATNIPDYVAEQMYLPENTAVFRIKKETKSQTVYIEKCEIFMVGLTYNIKHTLRHRSIS